MCRFYIGIPAVVSSIFFGIFLPTLDVGSDIRLALRLYVNGHSNWAFSVLTPIFINTFFSAIACMEIERKRASGCWIMWYLTLVLLQIYPQFCIIRLLHEFMRGRMDLNSFVSARDSIDGGIGCLEPYCESVVQVLVQTALFAEQSSRSERLFGEICVTSREAPCAMYNACNNDLHGCLMDPNANLELNYTKQSVNASNEVKVLCKANFDNCSRSLVSCIDNCKRNLTQYLYDMDYQHKTNGTQYMDFLDTSELDDLTKVTEIHELIIGNYQLFISTYIISIAAACWGITKLFRLSHARIAKKIFTRRFMFISLVSTIYFGMKVLLLGIVVTEERSSLAEAVGLWIFFAILPTTAMVMLFTIVFPCIKLFKKYGTLYINTIVQMILKQPCLLLAPHLTPFFFTLNIGNAKLVDDISIYRIEDGNRKKRVSICISYLTSLTYTFLNSFLSMILMWACFIWNGKSQANPYYYPFIGLASMFFLIGFFSCGFWCIYRHEPSFHKLRKDLYCVEHEIEHCPDCMRVYSFYQQDFMSIEECEDHEQTPYEYKTDIRDCEICTNISMR